jgi:preprotein translocase subunit SecG
MLHTFLTIIHFFCAAGIVTLVLVQRGKGADAGAGFGAGASGTVFGARGAGTALSRATAVLAAIFMVTSLSLAYVGTGKVAEPTSLLDRLSQPATAPKSLPQTGVNSAPAQPVQAPK